jgi:predicted HAD superfamily Cof-like phosphohydrolase
MIKYVQQFHERFELPTGEHDVLMDNVEMQDFRLKFLQEELDELREALERGNRVGAFDALLDLVYVAHGTALMMGVSPEQWHAGMTVVQQCNMSKVRVKSADESKRGSAFDVKKPEGWQGPEPTLAKILSWPS